MENNAADTVQHQELVLKCEPEEKGEKEHDVTYEEEEEGEEDDVEKWEQELKNYAEQQKLVELKDEEEEEEDDNNEDQEQSSRYRYTKEELMEIKQLPISNERPSCLSKMYDSDGVWDPEKWYALKTSSDRSPLPEGLKRDDKADDRPTLKRRIQDPRERVKEDDLDVVLSPQRRSFGSGCQGSAATSTPPNRRPISPLETTGSGRRIGSGRIMTRSFERDARVDKDRVGDRERVSERERDRAGDRERDRAGERERDYKDKRFRRDFVDKRTFGDRRRTESYAEEEPEWFSAGPSSQFETIELSGFDEKFLEDDKRKSKRSRKRTESTKEASGLNGGQAEEQGAAITSSADQEVPHNDLPEQPSTDFDFNEFFSQDAMPSVFHNLLTEGPILVSRFTQWFATNTSPSGSHSGSRRSTPHEELEELGGPVHLHTGTYFRPIRQSENVDIVELLQRANVDMATLSSNRAQLRENIYNGMVLSVEEVEGEMQGMRINSSEDVSPTQEENGTPTQLNQAFLTTPGSVPFKSDANMSAFDKLVNSMMASGTLPAQPTVERDHLRIRLGNLNTQGNVHQMEAAVTPTRTTTPPAFSVTPDFIHSRLETPPGIGPSLQHRMRHNFGTVYTPISDRCFQSQRFFCSTPVTYRFGQTVAQSPTLDLDCSILNSSPGFSNTGDPIDPNPQISEASSTPPVRNILHQAFTPTSVIRNLYASRERTREDSASSPGAPEIAASPAQDGHSSPNLVYDGPILQSRTIGSGSQNSPAIDLSRPQPGSAESRSQHVSSSASLPTFLSPIYPSALRPQVPMVRSSQLHPHVMPRMLAGRMQTPGVRPTFIRGRVYPHHVERTQHVNSPVFRQPLYPVSTAGYQTARPRTQNRSSANRFQRYRGNAYPRTPYPRTPYPHSPYSPSPTQSPYPARSYTLTAYPQQGSPSMSPQDSSPDLTRWFGSEVLEQPLPSMPTKVISVEELEFSP